MKLLRLIFCLLIVYGCNRKPNSEAYLEIRYRHPGALFPMTIPCPDMKQMNSKSGITIWYDFKITDEELLEKFYLSYLKLKPDETGEAYFDTQAGILFHHDNQVDTICTNYFGQTVLNGTRQKDNSELFSLIKDSIAKNFEPISREIHKDFITK